ncbi:hypothetical protein NCCP2495_07770 [Dietzia sp. NCCP-2495]|nr:hypothetical protein NCCP2495_07770 [Dietzia sp. NCCP-2495]
MAVAAASESPAWTVPSGVVEAMIVPPVVQITTWGVSVLVSALFTRSTVVVARPVVNHRGRQGWNNDAIAAREPHRSRYATPEPHIRRKDHE